MNEMTYIILAGSTVIAKVYMHPEMGRTICMERSVYMDDVIVVYKIKEDGKHEKVSERQVIDFFKDLLPKEH